ncbi:RNA polymerase sigma factor [Edaphobacter sp. 12200R-103]|uniref:RNA polymerase sigma factor n=1 Tax=Edaphobacter sp. 12200R-103 TaxID=2703788 RepID=UPI00138BC240|nr:hypothetical protein [Edaphobacter sp. 12200R-103]QHS50423.1 hypothetical protein GWR55_00645 [Edaphobacter sp. 12200R-103]
MLKARYSQLLIWAQNLTRGDVSRSQDIVQELCLYFTLKRPDLSNVENVDGYLYTCLRHICLSNLARASREADHLISIADFDSFDFAINSKRSGDPLERQNDLRRICNFSVWRKEKSKSASYFILHFFHGYSRQETADLARLPISAIYNKLKVARLEIKSHLEDSGKLRIANSMAPPPAPRSWTLLSAPDLFQELRDAILGARLRACLPELQLLAYYAAGQSEPIPCALLSHIVSCERCLDLIDQYFQRPGLADREPLDSMGFAGDVPPTPVLKDALENHVFELLKRRWKHVYEHRPNTLSIAHNGSIVASHDVVSSRSTLSARVVAPERDSFIEVFSEQDVRLALLSIEDVPPEGPSRLEQRIHLSDSRWLEVLVTFDGLGLHSQVTYYDEALIWDRTLDKLDTDSLNSAAIPHKIAEVSPSKMGGTAWDQIRRTLRALTPTPVLAWSLTLLLFVGMSGYVLLRDQRRPLDVTIVLDRSIKAEIVASQGTTEHQLLRVEEITANGGIKQRGTIEMWKDGDGGRFIRRFYDTKHHLVAAAWHNKSGTHSHVEDDQNRSNDQNELLAFGLWQQEISAVGFRKLGGQESFAATADGYELTTALPSNERSHFVSATLVLDKNFRPLQQTLEVRNGKRTLRLRWTQVSLERTASASVPDSRFDLTDAASGPSTELRSPFRRSTTNGDHTGARIAGLQIATLYQLYELSADVGQPIEVARTGDGRLRISGSVEDPALRRRIVTRLKKLENSELLDLQLNQSSDAATPHTNQAQRSNTLLYEIKEAKPVIEPSLRAYLSSKNISEEKLNPTMEQYSRHVLLSSQRALQDAYALHRLGSVFSISDMSSLDLASRRRWAEMVGKHSADLNSELNSLSEQLLPIDPAFHNSISPQASQIENGEQFFQTTDELLHRMQYLNQVLGILFTSNTASTNQVTPLDLLERGLSAMPLSQAAQLDRFASRLKASEKAQSKSSTPDENIGQAPEP